jgi:hypothetical protein
VGLRNVLLTVRVNTKIEISADQTGDRPAQHRPAYPDGDGVALLRNEVELICAVESEDGRSCRAHAIQNEIAFPGDWNHVTDPIRFRNRRPD